MKQVCFLILLIAGIAGIGQNKTTTIGIFSPSADLALLISRHVNKILQDKAGTLWFGTNDGICSYNGESLVYFGKTEGLDVTGVRDIVEDDNGNIWFCSQGNGVCRFDGKSFTIFSEKEGVCHNNVWCALNDKSGNLWFGTENGVCRYDGNTFNNFFIPPANIKDGQDVYPRSKQIWSIIKDKSGNIWFGTNGGAYRYDGTSLTNFSVKEGLIGNIVFCMLEDKTGNIWFGTNHGACRYDGRSFTKINAEEGFVGNENLKSEIRSIVEDDSGNIWISVPGTGVYRLNGRTVTHFSNKDGLSNYYVTGMLQDKAGNFWFGGGEGLFRYDGKSFIRVTRGGPWPKIR